MPQQSLHNTEGTKRERHPDLFASLLQFDNPQDGEYVYTYIYIKEIWPQHINSQKNLATRNKFIYIYMSYWRLYFQLHYWVFFIHFLRPSTCCATHSSPGLPRRPYTQGHGLIGSTPQFWKEVGWVGSALWGCTTPYTFEKFNKNGIPKTTLRGSGKLENVDLLCKYGKF